jgi:GNAT superfamily N-acetyltransferase
MIEIRSFDPAAASVGEWAELHRHRRIRAAEDEPGEPVLSDSEFEHDARRRWPTYESRRLVAWSGGEVVGDLGVGFRREGTPDYAAYAPLLYGWGGVERAWRRQGVATALARSLLTFMQERGKTTATFGTHLPEGRGFLAAIGAVEKHRSVINRLAFASLDWAELARWEAAAIPPGTGLRWEVHAGRVPAERLAELQPQVNELIRDVPMGELEAPPPRVEVASYLAWYEEMDRRGGEHFLVLLLDGDAVAGLCEATWSARFPDRMYQEYTAVARAWRGRGLAKGMKAAVLRLVRARHPEVRMASTGNSELNDPILAINRQLGFEVYRRDSSYQLNRDALAHWLAGR